MAQSTFLQNSIFLAILAAACGGGGGLVTGGGDPADSAPASGGQGSGGAAVGTGGAATCELPELGGVGGEGPPTGTAVERYGHLRVEGTHLVSAAGEPVQLRGVSSMWLNWENDGYATSLPALQFMRDSWGMQIFRAAMGVDADGGYAMTGKSKMVGQVNTIVENAEKLGIYVIVDFHTHHGEDYQAQAIEFFTDISARYGHLPNLILEPFNEPLAVNWTTTLKPYHEAVLAAIRAADPDGIPNVAILGTPNWCQDVDDVVGAQVSDPQVMYTVHFYSCSHGASLLNKAKAAYAAGVPIFVTEWGATNADGGVNGTPVCGTPQADLWLDWLDQEKIGWAAWKLDNCEYELDQNGAEDTSCLLSADASVNGGWTDADLNGHAPYVISRMGCR
jgi:endoglucanase